MIPSDTPTAVPSTTPGPDGTTPAPPQADGTLSATGSAPAALWALLGAALLLVGFAYARTRRPRED